MGDFVADQSNKYLSDSNIKKKIHLPDVEYKFNVERDTI